MEGAGLSKGFQCLDEGRLFRSGREVHREVGALEPLECQADVDGLAMQELVYLVSVPVFYDECDAKGPVAGLPHDPGQQVVAVDGHDVAIADSVGEERQTGHLERIVGELAGPQLLAPAVLPVRQVGMDHVVDGTPADRVPCVMMAMWCLPELGPDSQILQQPPRPGCSGACSGAASRSVRIRG